MRSVAWLFAGTEPALPPEAHSTEKSRIGKAIHAATRMRPHDSDISFLMNRPLRCVQKRFGQHSTLLKQNIRSIDTFFRTTIDAADVFEEQEVALATHISWR
jgi:hypothetical protein